MWTVRYEKAIDEQIAEYRDHQGPCRIDDVIDGVEWAVANNPDHWPKKDDMEYHVALTEPVDGLPGLLVAYSVHHDERLVALEFLTEVETFEEEDFS